LQAGQDMTLVAPSIRTESLSITAGQVNGVTVDADARIAFLGVKESSRMNIKLLGQLSQRLVASQGGNRHLGFELRRVIPPFPSRHALAPQSSALRGHGLSKAITYSIVRISGPALSSGTICQC
jgi:hypothetical protein